MIDTNLGDPAAFLQADETTDKLFGEDLGLRHPLADDIVRAIAALLPQRTGGMYLHEVVGIPRAQRFSLAAMFEIAPALVNQQAVEFVTRAFEDESQRRKLFALAASTFSQANHPLNATFWSDRLKSLTLADRDLSWTEHVRRNVELFEQLALQLEAASKQATLSEIAEPRAHLTALILRWCLTSSTPTLRDQVTRAIYYYARRWPSQHFNLLRESLPVNDPYVGERMLAVTYGVAMARQNDLEESSFATEMLPQLGRFLFEIMFAPEAAHSTTHFLARDYAWRTIDLVKKLYPALLSDEEARRTFPPFQDGGIREWGESADQGQGKYQDGNYPLSRYHSGPLEEPMDAFGPAGEKPNSAAYRRLLSNLWWRIHALGYSLDRFGQVDAAIMLDRQVVGWGLEKWLTNPYGRKYALIGAYELAGYLDDLGKLRFDPEESPIVERPPFIDLDPSFPSEPKHCAMTPIDLLGDPDLAPEEWVKAGNDPDVQDYCLQDSVCHENGPWVLLAAHLVQQEANPGRDVFFYTVGFIVNAATAASANDARQPRKGAVHLASRVPEVVYTFAGEIPWSDTYSPNAEETISLRADIKVKPEGFIAVTRHGWESYHSSINPSFFVYTPARQIADQLNLVGHPQTFDFYEPDGRRASISFQPPGSSRASRQTMTYIRRDLIDRFLAETGSNLLWLTWGERQVLSQNENQLSGTLFRPFQEVSIYGS